MSLGVAILFSIGLLVLSDVVAAIIQVPSLITGILMVVGTAIWAGVDASKIELRKYKKQCWDGPSVFLFVLFFWIIGFPWYLSVRNKIFSGELKKDNYDELLDQLEKLSELRKRNILTEEEFLAQKRKILP